MNPSVLYFVWTLIFVLNLIVGAIFLSIPESKNKTNIEDTYDFSVTPNTDPSQDDNLIGYHRAIFIAPFVILPLMILTTSFTNVTFQVTCGILSMMYIVATMVLIGIYLQKETTETYVNLTYQLSPILLAYGTAFILLILYLVQNTKDNKVSNAVET
jgi:hypothetical protein